jgi:hypothetical protein
LQRRKTDPSILETASRAVTGYMQSRTDAQRSLRPRGSVSLSGIFCLSLSPAPNPNLRTLKNHKP